MQSGGRAGGLVHGMGRGTANHSGESRRVGGAQERHEVLG